MVSSGRLSILTAILAFTCALMLVAGCGPALHPMPDNPVNDPAVLLERMNEHASRLCSLSAIARLKNESSHGVVRGRITILASIDGRLRVDGWTPTDSLVATLTAGPDDFNYFERGADECLTGRSCPENLALLLPVGMEVRQTAGFLFGLPPIKASASEWTVTFDRRAGAYRLVSRVKDGGWQRVWIRGDGIPVAAELQQGKKLVYRMDASDFQMVAGRVFPMKVRLKATRFDTSLTVKYRSVDLEPVIAQEDWGFQCPEGMDLRVVRCGGL